MNRSTESQESRPHSSPKSHTSDLKPNIISLAKSKSEQPHVQVELSSKQILGKIQGIVGEVPGFVRKQSMKSLQSGPGSGDFKCKCKKTKCLKMYCECFAMGRLCNGCVCVGCNNLLSFQQQRANAIDQALERDPNLFQAPLSQNRGGCICKKTGCLKKYCECYNLGVSCTSECKCVNCCNQP